jgi:hypothetical protein
VPSLNPLTGVIDPGKREGCDRDQDEDRFHAESEPTLAGLFGHTHILPTYPCGFEDVAQRPPARNGFEEYRLGSLLTFNRPILQAIRVDPRSSAAAASLLLFDRRSL